MVVGLPRVSTACTVNVWYGGGADRRTVGHRAGAAGKRYPVLAAQEYAALTVERYDLLPLVGDVRVMVGGTRCRAVR